MPSSIESLKSLTISQLEKYAKSLRAQIKVGAGSEFAEEKIGDMRAELKLVQSVIAEKRIEEAKLLMVKNQILEALKKTKP